MLLKLKKMDWYVVAILFLFMIFGTLLIHSAVRNNADMQNYDVRNVILYGLGFAAFFVSAFFDYRVLLKFSFYIYGIGIAMLIAVYFFGATINGSRGWFSLPSGFTFQPAELVKIILILTLAALLAKREGTPLTLVYDLVPVGLAVFIPFVLVMIQPDLGNAIIYLIIFLGMLWIGNIRYSYVLIGITVIVALMALFFYAYQSFHQQIYDYLQPRGGGHWVERIDTFLNPENVSADDSYQVRQAKIAIGSGGLTGTGYLQGESVKNGFVPLTYSDSIFIVVGEEFGFVGASILLLLYFLLIYRMVLISIQSDHISGSYVIVGIISMFVFQIFENIGMLVGIMPLTGITLPFISYGGSSLLINMVSVGLVMNIKVHQEKPSVFKLQS